MNQVTEQPTEHRHYLVNNVSSEEAQSSTKELSEIPKVRRMIQNMESADSFRQKYDEGLYISEAGYLASLLYSGEASVYDIISDVYNIGFKRGYNKAKRASTKKRGNAV